MNNPVPEIGGKKELPSRVTSLGWSLLVIGIVLVGLGYAVDPRRMAFDNVIGFLLVVSVAAGSVFLVALEYIGGAVWSVPMRRINEFLSSLTLVTPLLAVPLFFHLHDIFHWLHPEILGSDAMLAGKSPYLNVNFLVLRFVAVFVLWNAFMFVFTRNSRKQDVSKDPRLTTANIRLAAIFMPVFAITLTFTAIDWAMSLEPHWYSTIIGVYYFSGTVLAALSVATYIIVKLHAITSIASGRSSLRSSISGRTSPSASSSSSGTQTCRRRPSGSSIGGIMAGSTSRYSSSSYTLPCRISRC
jgi:hypothetical protein